MVDDVAVIDEVAGIMTKCMNLLANSIDFNRVWIDCKGKYPTFTLL